MKKLTALIAILIIVVGVILKLSGSNKHSNKMQNSSPSAETVSTTVNTMIAKKMAIDQSIELIGTLCAWKEISIAAETQGKIESLNFETGQSKSKGEVLARIDSKLKQLAVENAKINAVKLKNDLDRIENLFKGGTASQQELDNARYSYDNAEIALNEAEKQLSDATVISPFSGIIISKSAEQGAYINTGSAIATMVDISKLKVKLNVSETNVYRLSLGDKVVITTDVYPGTPFEGTISFISSQGDDSHNYPVEITMNNSKQNPLKAGTFVTVKIDIKDQQMRLYIPRKSLQGSTKDASVYIVDNGKALLKNVVVGSENGEYLEIVSGLSEGDNVVTAGQINLSDGKAVTVVNK